MNHHKMLTIETQLIHHQSREPQEGNRPLVNPTYHSVKYLPSNMAHLRRILKDRSEGYLYSRIANPTVRELEVLLAQLQQRDDAIATASGIAAISAIAMAFLKAGDRAVVFTESYKPTRYLLEHIMTRFGIEAVRVSRNDYQSFDKLMNETNPPKLVFLESPTNPTLRIHDLEHIINTCKHAGALTVLDNTFAGFLNHGNLEIDLYVHSLTKQASGHSDVMGGVVIANSQLINQMLPTSITLGACLDPQAASLILRGLKTYSVRTKEASKSALEIATWLSNETWAKEVRYPSLPNHPDHELWKKQQPHDPGSVVTFDLDLPDEKIDLFFDHLSIFGLAPSLGCVESLAVPCLLLFADDLSPEEATSAGVTSKTVRLAIGLENPEDLKQDLLNAIQAAKKGE
jgi:cystathionine beta-lyase/cystathionine gamma-synthase